MQFPSFFPRFVRGRSYADGRKKIGNIDEYRDVERGNAQLWELWKKYHSKRKFVTECRGVLLMNNLRIAITLTVTGVSLQQMSHVKL